MNNLSKPQFKGVYFQHGTAGPNYDGVTAYDSNHDELGHIGWMGGTTGEIKHINVHPDHQRKGLGTELLSQAKMISKKKKRKSPTHSSERTEEGDSWAKKVGGKVPHLKNGIFVPKE